ncbi:DUF1656 domain-containing protein [Indioceanicola profundi]|uniref:DUF1656 domain-containing protein n=1 Tax=Indioceanicola profundi TaxID=2220096 RepID=UPI000E6A9C19|nr:DUF1656 domain-containing protein [Indioceanicola profundi]
MTGEYDLAGVLVAPMLVWALLAFVICLGIYRVLGAVGAYRFVWHRSLFNTALYVLVLGTIAAAVS